MEPTPAPPASAAVSTADSVDSSPLSRTTDNFEGDPAPAPPQKLRLMCSYGGHIVPRPHDKTLCYVGGDTRIIVIDRHTSLSDLHHRLSKTLLHSQSFLLKYQLPNEDLDSLISVTTDEDLENMVEECDRLNSGVGGGGGLKQGRLRLFLFPKSQSNIEQLLVETGSGKSEDWFFNALNGKTGMVSGSDRGFSESSSINNLLGLDEDPVGKVGIGGKEGEIQVEGGGKAGSGNGGGGNHDVHSVPGSPMLDTTSSFGSTNSSPSMSNLPPIRVHLEENLTKVGVVGIEDQFQEMNVGGVRAAPPRKAEESGGFVAPAAVVFSDEQQVQLQVQGQAQLPPQIPQKSSGVTDLPSPDSVSSEGSARNPRQIQALYQDPTAQIQSLNSSRVTQNQGDIKIQVQPQVQEHGYVLSGQYDQTHATLHHPQQFVHAGNQYIPAGAMPIASYYHPVYAHQQQQHTLLDQPYPLYFMPAPPTTQAYNLQSQQPGYGYGYGDITQSVPSSRPQTPPPPTGVPHHVAYSSTISGPSSKPELATGVYRTAAAPQQLVQHPSSQQHQPQYVGFGQISHPSQSINASPFAYEFADPTQPQMHYTQHLPPQLAAHYQTLIPNASSQLPAENMKHQVKTPQP